jgi:hypothetical protein
MAALMKKAAIKSARGVGTEQIPAFLLHRFPQEAVMSNFFSSCGFATKRQPLHRLELPRKPLFPFPIGRNW